MAEGSARTKLATVALVIVGFALGFAEFIVIGITPDIAEEYGISLASAGNLVGFFAISYAVSTPIIVLSTGRFRRFPLFVTFLAVFNAGNLLAIVAPTYETLLVARVLTAVVSGVLLSTVMTFINDIIPREKSARIISFVYARLFCCQRLGYAHWHAACRCIRYQGCVYSGRSCSARCYGVAACLCAALWLHRCFFSCARSAGNPEGRRIILVLT